MAYTPNTANANGINEATFQALYTQNKDAIDAYVRAHPNGKDPREAAFKAVTGQPWPDGRGVNDAGQMTKDRTVKSVLGKYVAPIAAGALTAGLAIPALAGGGAAAGAAGAGGAAAAGGGAGAAGTAATVAAGTAAKAGMFGKMASMAASPLVGAAGSALSSVAQSGAHNRGVQLDADLATANLDQQAERDYQAATINREQEGRAGQKSAWEMLNRASYVKNAPSNVNTTNLSPYSRAVAGPSAEARQGAAAMEADTLKRLEQGNPLEMPRRVGTDVTLRQPGMLERIGNVAGPVLTAGGYFNQMGRMVNPAAPPVVPPTSRPGMPRMPASFINPDYYIQ